MTTEDIYVSYISNFLIKEIAEKLLPEKIIDFNVQDSGGLDGFMSVLYEINIKTLDETENKENSHKLIAKFMKGDEDFRVSSRCYIQFANEILIYSQVIPYYSEVVSKLGIKSIKPDDWIANTFAAKFGKIDGLSTDKVSNDSVLVLKHLKPEGYAMGPKLYLDRDHMLKMVKPLAEYHGMCYALKIQKDKQLEKLIQSVIPLPFIELENTSKNFYDVVYRVAFDRFFDYFERSRSSLISKNNPKDVGLENNIDKLKKKYFSNPTSLLQRIYTIHDDSDKLFAAILHGDFNRNNVMFRYEKGDSAPKDCKMIDFQELRYGTPCIDLTFAMFMNIDCTKREELWMEILQFYHNNLIETISTVLKASDNFSSDSLNSFSFEEFLKHFKKFGFYGVMICMHFLPWLCGTEEKLNLLATLWESDLHGKEFHKISMTAGGDEANRKIFDIVKHAHLLGYMDAI